MAQQSSDRGMPALVDLQNLINLLALRAGNPIRPTVPSVDAEDLGAILDESSDIESFTNTAGQGQLSQTRSHDALRKRFLDRLAELFSAERNGFFVTAAVLREVECEDAVDIWLARNNGFLTANDKDMIRAIENELSQLARDTDRGNANLLNHMIRYSSQRLDTYDGDLRRLLNPHKTELVAPSSSMIGDLHFRNNVYSHFFRSKMAPRTNMQRLDYLVRLGADARRAVHSDNDRVKALEGPPWVRRAVTRLCLVGKVDSACHTFAEATTELWRGYTFKINYLQVYPPARVPRVRLSIPSALERADVPMQDHISKSGTEGKFAKFQGQVPHVHAEIQLLFHLAKKRITGVFPYIGASKLPCVLCATMLEIEGTLPCRKSHEHLYPRWMVPDMKTLPQDTRNQFWTVITKLKETLRTTLLSVPEKAIDFRPESTVDMTVASSLSGESWQQRVWRSDWPRSSNSNRRSKESCPGFSIPTCLRLPRAL